MISRKHMIADFKQMRREVILILFTLIPIVMIAFIKVVLVYGTPILYRYIGFDLLTYEGYLLGMVYLVQPVLLGTVMGFFMLDEKDSKIFELLRVTPLGYSGYLLNRLVIPVAMTIIYTVMSYVVIGTLHSISILVVIVIFMSIQTVGIGLFISMVSEDKVKGLTYAKAVSGLMLFGFVRLIPNEFIKILGHLTPYYYVVELIIKPSIIVGIIGFIVHGIWIGLIYFSMMRRL